MNEQAWKEQAGLEPCPFCEQPLTIGGGVNPYGRCDTKGCWMNASRISVAIDDPKMVAIWNTRHLVQQAIAAERGEPVAVPHVVYDMKMPPYHYQKPYTGSGGSISVPSAPPTEAQIRADERERCAAWLREDEQGRFVEGPEIEETFYNRDDYTGEECTWTEKRKPRRLRTRFDFAEAIERGEHAAIRSLKEADNGAGNECICPKCGLRHGGKVDSGAVF